MTKRHPRNPVIEKRYFNPSENVWHKLKKYSKIACFLAAIVNV